MQPDVRLGERKGQSRNCTAEKRSESDKEGFQNRASFVILERPLVCHGGGGMAPTRLMTFPSLVSDRECVSEGHVDGVHLSSPS